MTVCVLVNGEKFQSHNVTLTLIRQYPMSNLSELFPYTTVCSSFKWIEPLFLSYSVHRQTDRHTDTKTDIHTDEHEYSIVAVEKPQQYYNYKVRSPTPCRFFTIYCIDKLFYLPRFLTDRKFKRISSQE